MCFGCSKEPSHRDGSFEYPQHIFELRNKKNIFQLGTLIWGPDIICVLWKKDVQSENCEVKSVSDWQCRCGYGKCL